MVKIVLVTNAQEGYVNYKILGTEDERSAEFASLLDAHSGIESLIEGKMKSDDKLVFLLPTSSLREDFLQERGYCLKGGLVFPEEDRYLSGIESRLRLREEDERQRRREAGHLFNLSEEGRALQDRLQHPHGYTPGDHGY